MSDQAIDRTKLPIRRPAFSGVANKTLGGSQPSGTLRFAQAPPGSRAGSGRRWTLHCHRVVWAADHGLGETRLLGKRHTPRVRMARRLAAILALVALVVLAGFLVDFWVRDFPVALATLGVLCLGAAGIWLALTRRGWLRGAGGLLAVAGLAGVLAVLIWQGAILELVGIVVSAVVAVALARFAQGTDRVTLRSVTVLGEPAPAMKRPILLMNPWSGGGKVDRFGLVEEARRRGIEPVLLERGLDLRELALDAVRRGADGLGMAGGDGSQAIVATVAMEHGLPYVCVPAGTRNHLALDLGLDRDDVVGSLDAYIDGFEHAVDLATVNGRVFVNNVSLGLYAKVVQSDAYRDAKLRTAAEMLPELLGPDAERLGLEFDGPTGDTHDAAQLIMVSNNPYRLTQLFGVGSRPRLDTGELGIIAIELKSALELEDLILHESFGRISRYSGWREWSAPTFEVRSHEKIEAGVDGEALVFEPPLRFAIIPGALRIRIPRQAPGLSPAAATPAPSASMIKDLVRIAAGRAPAEERVPEVSP